MEYSTISSGRELLSARLRKQDFPSYGQKSVEPSGSWLEGKELDSRRDAYHDMMAEPRFALREQLTAGVWLDNSNLVLVTKEGGSFWQYMGVEADIGKCLYPEEAIYLIETGVMEVSYGEIPLSLQSAMKVMLPSSSLLDKYLVYAHLSRTGCKVVRHQSHLQFTSYEKQIRIDQYQTKRKREKIKLSEKNKKEDDRKGNQDKTIDTELDDFYAMLGTSDNIKDDVDMKEKKKVQDTSVAKKRKFEEVLIDIDTEYDSKRSNLLDMFPQMIGQSIIKFEVPSGDLLPVMPAKSEYVIDLSALNYYSKYLEETEKDDGNNWGNTRSDRGMKWGRGNRGRGGHWRNDWNQSNSKNDWNRHQQSDKSNYRDRRGGKRREDYRENVKRTDRGYDEKSFDNRDHWGRHTRNEREPYRDDYDRRLNDENNDSRHMINESERKKYKDEPYRKYDDNNEGFKHHQTERSNYSERKSDRTLEDCESKHDLGSRQDEKSSNPGELDGRFGNKRKENWESNNSNERRLDSWEYNSRENEIITKGGFDEKGFESRNHWGRHQRNGRERFGDEHDRRWDDEKYDTQHKLEKSERKPYKDEHDNREEGFSGNMHNEGFQLSQRFGSMHCDNEYSNQESNIPNIEVVVSEETVPEETVPEETVPDFNIKPEWKNVRRERKRPQKEFYPKTLIKVDPNRVRNWKDYKNLLIETGEESLLQSGPNGALWRRGTKPLLKPSMASNHSSVLSLINLHKAEDNETKPKMNISNPLVLSYDVYLPSKLYKKSCPSLPDKRVTIMREVDIPSLDQILEVSSRFDDGVSVICGVVVAGDVRTYTLAPVDLPNPTQLINASLADVYGD